MKKIHLFILIVIGALVAIIFATTRESSEYLGFSDAKNLAVRGNNKEIHVVGQLKKDAYGKPVGIEEGLDKVSVSFLLIDENGVEQQVFFNQPMPQDMLRSEKVVVIGRYLENGSFLASKILLKCPSKYQEQPSNV